MNLKELRTLSEEELRQKEKSLNEELFKLNARRFSGTVDKPHLFSLIKKDLARIQTLFREQQVQQKAKEKTNG